MTAAGERIANEISAGGPISFRRFMEIALYDPMHGYYCRPRDPFGKSGDFFTAAQLQPVFGLLAAERVRRLFQEMGEPADFTLVELGAGRGEMAPAFHHWRYIPVEVGAGEIPTSFRGVVFSNEFFDALPVEVAVYGKGSFRRQLVDLAGERFVWRLGETVEPEVAQFLRSYYPEPEEGLWYEANLAGLEWLERAAHALTEGYVLTIDYGFTRDESIRFPAGTLMGYRRHTAREDVLEDPGERDITAHVNFTALQEAGARAGLVTERFETLAQMLLAAGESDQFAAVLAASGEPEALRRRMQLKTLLFGMGETFRVLTQRRRTSE